MVDVHALLETPVAVPTHPISAVEARDLVVRCFCQAQKQTFARAHERLGAPVSDSDLLESIRGVVRSVFRQRGFDFEQPTQSALGTVLEALVDKAQALGTPKDIIDEHHGRMLQIIAKVRD